MDAGTIRAVGIHTDLIQVDALYAELATTQFLAPTRSEDGVEADRETKGPRTGT